MKETNMPEESLYHHLKQADEHYDDPPHVERNQIADLMASAQILDGPASWQKCARAELLAAALAAACDAEIMDYDEWEQVWRVDPETDQLGLLS